LVTELTRWSSCARGGLEAMTEALDVLLDTPDLLDG